jgi:hypothetical protein
MYSIADSFVFVNEELFTVHFLGRTCTILQDLLATMPYRDLRGAATRLQRRQDRQHQKHDWITANCHRLANSRHARAHNGSKRRTDRRTAMQRIGGAEATQRFRPAFFAFMLPID